MMSATLPYLRKIFPKNNMSYPLIRTRTCAYQGVRNVSFSENFAYVLNEYPHFIVMNMKFTSTLSFNKNDIE